MSNVRKRRVDAKEYTFVFNGHSDVLIGQYDKSKKKTFVYEAVILKLAKKLSGYNQSVYSLYRDLHKSKSASEIFGLRAICIEDFNQENLCCKLQFNDAPGKDALMIQDVLQ